MNTPVDLLALVAAYQPALLSLSALCLVVLTQTVLTAPLALASGEQSPGEPLRGNHELFSFRVLRTQANSVEALGPFSLAVFVAVLASVNSALVNWLAGLHLLFRVLFWVIYYSGKGRVAGGPRTIAFIGGLFTNVILAGACVQALLF